MKYLVKRNTSCYNHVKMLGAKIYGFHKDKKVLFWIVGFALISE